MAARKAYWEYNKYRELLKNMGDIELVPFDEVADHLDMDLESWQSGSLYPLHPVFLLAEHFMSEDGSGYERPYVNIHWRGNTMLIPAYSEYGDVYLIALGFHKGETKTGLVRFINPPTETKEKLLEIVQMYETR
jgi:hypothetical protein